MLIFIFSRGFKFKKNKALSFGTNTILSPSFSFALVLVKLNPVETSLDILLFSLNSKPLDFKFDAVCLYFDEA